MSAANLTAPRTLIADDQPDVLEALRLLLKGEGYQTEGVSTPNDVIEALKSHDFDLLLMDLNYARDTTSGQEGLDLLSRVQAVDSTLPIVVMTAWGSVELAVEAMQRGVRDFVLKPWENNRLLSILRTQIEMGHALRKTQRLKKEQEREPGQIKNQFAGGNERPRFVSGVFRFWFWFCFWLVCRRCGDAGAEARGKVVPPAARVGAVVSVPHDHERIPLPRPQCGRFQHLTSSTNSGRKNSRERGY